MKKCRICKKEFEPFNSLATACSGKCALELVKQKKDKKHKRELTTFRNENKTLQKRIDEAQASFNAYIRERDKYKPCVSCGATESPRWDCGHYRARGGLGGHLRYHTLNAWKQCSKCNTFLSGNIVEYRKELINRIGAERLDELDNDYQTVKFTKEYLIRIKKIFAERTRHLKRIRSKSL